MVLLRNRGFVLLAAGQCLGILADWSLRTALLIWVYQLTHSGVAVSLVGLAEALPLLVLSPVAGVFVDRWSRARTMAGAVLVRALLLLPLLAVHDRDGLPLILIVAVLANSASQFFMTAAGAALPIVVGQELLGQANSLLQMIAGIVPVLAPAVAALLLAGIGPHGLVVILIVLYAIAIPVLALVPAPRPAARATATTSVLAEMLAGLRYVRHSRLLISLIAVAFVALLGVGALSVLDVVFVTRALHLPTTSVGVLLTANGAGQLLGGIATWLLSRWAARRYHLLLGCTIILNGLALIPYCLAPSLVVAAAAQVVSGAGFPPLLVAFMTLTQSVTEDAYMGRVMSLINMGLAVAMIISMASGGALTDLFGVRQVIGGAAVLVVASGLLSLLLIRATPLPRSEPAASARVPTGRLSVTAEAL